MWKSGRGNSAAEVIGERSAIRDGIRSKSVVENFAFGIFFEK